MTTAPEPARWRRGDVVVCAMPGELGKPRPAVVVLVDDIVGLLQATTVCPLTSHDLDAPRFRPAIAPSAANGLTKLSFAMTDKVSTLANQRLRGPIGKLDAAQMRQLDAAMAYTLGLRPPPA